MMLGRALDDRSHLLKRFETEDLYTLVPVLERGYTDCCHICFCFQRFYFHFLPAQEVGAC